MSPVLRTLYYRCQIRRGYVSRSIDVQAVNEPHARQIAESQCGDGEIVPRGFSAVMLLSRVTVDPTPIMPSDHARNVARAHTDQWLR